MPVNEWPTNADSGGRSPSDRDAARAAMREARDLLHELRETTTRLGEALADADFAPNLWRAPEGRLDSAAENLPDVTVDALLKRLVSFAMEEGPARLDGDGQALNEFENEVWVLADVIRPLRALAQRQHLAPRAKRGTNPLLSALGDNRVGAQLDRMTRTLRALTEVAPHLEPLPPGQDVGPSAPLWPAESSTGTWGDRTWGASQPSMSAPPFAASTPPGNLDPAGTPGKRGTGMPKWLARMQGRLGQSAGGAGAMGGSPRWPGGGLVQRVKSLRPARVRPLVAGALALGLLLVVVSGALALAHMRSSSSGGGFALTGTAPTLPAGTATAIARATYIARGTATARARSALFTPTTAPARLSVSPANFVMPCSGSPSQTLKLQDSGAQALTWRASASGSVVFSATSGTLDAYSGSSITVHASSGRQHGSGTITFTWGSGTVSIAYSVFCH